MIFANVTDITIPQGNVVKIHETISGRVLWEKKNSSTYSSYPYFIYISNGNKINDMTQFFGTGYGGLGNHLSGRSTVRSLSLGSCVVSSNGVRLIISTNEIAVGDTFTACYVTCENDESNIPTTAKKVNDAVWKTTPLYLSAHPDLAPTYQGYLLTSSVGTTKLVVPTNSLPITFSSLTGATISVSGLNKNFSTYKSIFEAHSSDSLYTQKSERPYLYGVMALSWSSSSFYSLIGDSMKTGDSQIILFFTIAR